MAAATMAMARAEAMAQMGRKAPPRLEQMEENLPLPPIPPVNPPLDVPAPVPDLNLHAPADPVQEGPVLKPTLTEQAPTLPRGDPVPGTVYRSDQEQRRQFIPKPGIQLVVPLEK
jgi:hypothetical protein